MSSVPSPSHNMCPRVAFITGGLKSGGSAMLVLLLTQTLKELGVECTIYSFGENQEIANEYKRCGIDCHTVGETAFIFEDKLRFALSFLSAYKPTAVVSCLGALSFEVLRYLPAGIQRIGMVVADDPTVYQMVSYYTQHLEIICGNARTITDHLSALPKFDSVRKEWFVTGVKPPILTRPPAELNAPLRIVTLSRIVQEQKRVQLFPLILSDLAKSGRSLEWTIIGDGSDLPWLKETMPPLAKNVMVRFAGEVPFMEVDQWLCRQDVFLLTSDYEGLPLALVHAMMNGVVPVVSDIPSGIPELVNPETGLVVNIADTAGYARAILELDADRAKLAALSASSRALALEKYSVQAMARQWLNFLQKPAMTASVAWPARFSIKAPLPDPRWWYYHPITRILRRLLKSKRSK